MSKISLIACLSVLLLFTGSALAVGPAELMIYGGPTVSGFSGGYDLGASALIDLPLMPKVGVEAEKSFLSGDINITRLGLVYAQTLIPFLASIKVSAGSSSIASNVAFSIGGQTFAASAATSGYYATAGLVIKILNLAVNPKVVYNQYGSVAVAEGIINAGLTF